MDIETRTQNAKKPHTPKREDLNRLLEAHCLQNRAVIVVEHGHDEPLPENIPAYETIDSRRYGKTGVTILKS